jgi:sulfate adenylyltransferase
MIGLRARTGARPRPNRLNSLVNSVETPGACVWLTGLSGAGTSSTAQATEQALVQRGYRVVLLDGDKIRALSRDLGFSNSDRHAQAVRVATMARHQCDLGAIVLCALISPYAESREQARTIVGRHRFVEILVDTPLEVCEARDTKGLYALARSGKLKGFTGIDDPYERPLNPDLVIHTVSESLEQNVETILRLLRDRGFVTS